MKIQFSFDDTDNLNYKLFDIMEQYNYSVVWFLDFRNIRLAKNQIAKFSKKHEIGNHTMSHQWLTRLNYDDIEYEIKEARETIRQITGKKPEWFCPPRGYTNEQIDKFVKFLGHKHIRLTTTDKWVHIYPRPEYKGKSPFEVATTRLKEDGKVHIWGHSWEIEKYDYWEMLKDFLNKNNEKN